VLIYPYAAGRNARLRYQLRRARVLAHSLLAWALALPLVVLRVHPLPHLSAATPITQIQPSAPSQDTAAWARHELATRLGHRPALDAWSCGPPSTPGFPPDSTVLPSPSSPPKSTTPAHPPETSLIRPSVRLLVTTSNAKDALSDADLNGGGPQPPRVATTRA